MNGKSVAKEANRRFAWKLIVMGVALCACSGVRAQARIPDLVISSLNARLVASNRVQYSWTITNVGIGSARLQNVTVQAFLSKDTVFGNAGDVPAGGVVVGSSPLEELAPKASKNGTFTSNFQGNLAALPHLILKVDSNNRLAELNENNNTAAVGVAR